jgi:dienelactone hydrolase
MRVIGRLVLLVIALVVLGIGGVLAWAAMRDPLAALPVAREKPLATGFSSETRGNRLLHHLVLEAPELGRIGLAISLPDPLPRHKLPVIIVLGGLATGENNIRHITRAGDNAVIGYDWPIPTRLPQGINLLLAAPELYASAMRVPGQIAAALDWIVAQDWADAGRVSVLGFSLGALAAPAAEHLARRNGRSIGWTALAYGGTPLGAVLASNPFLKPRWAAPYLGDAADLLFRPLEPDEHLPHLAGKFLLIGGSDDAFIPEAASRRMRDLTPEPKTVLLFDGGHMGIGADKMALLAEIIAATTRWLVAEGAIEPPS